MSSFGKKILSAFVEVGDEKKEPAHEAGTSSRDNAAHAVESAPGVGGAAVLGDGRVVLVLDGEELIQLAARGIDRPGAAAIQFAS